VQAITTTESKRQNADQAVCRKIEHTACAEYIVDVDHLADWRSHHFAVEELAVWLTERFVRSHVVLDVSMFLDAEIHQHIKHC